MCKFTNRQIPVFIFLLCLLSRLAYLWLSGWDGFEIFGDSIRYDILSDRILAGQHDLDLIAFISPPLYPYFIALLKIVLGIHWAETAVYCQIILVALSSVGLYNTARLIFENQGPAVTAAVIYIFYPLTMWFNIAIGQESFFQSFFIFFLFHLTAYLKSLCRKHLVLMVLFLSLSILTKSHVSLLAPSLLLYVLLTKQYRHAFYIGILFLLFLGPLLLRNTLLYNKRSFSNYASGSMMLIGHSDANYACLGWNDLHASENDSAACDLNIVFNPNYRLDNYGLVNLEAPALRNRMRWCAALDWIKENPEKFILLKLKGLMRFLLPGVDWNVYRIQLWFASIIMGLLIYVPGYCRLIKMTPSRSRLVIFPWLTIFLIGLIFVFFYPQNRFRIITMEPVLIIFAAPYWWSLLKRRFPALINRWGLQKHR